MNRTGDGIDGLAEHMVKCRGAQAVVVTDGSADQVIADLVKAGWSLKYGADYVAGKRIRYLSPPGTAEKADEQPPCPRCGAPQQEEWSGVKCSSPDCTWWFCY